MKFINVAPVALPGHRVSNIDLSESDTTGSRVVFPAITPNNNTTVRQAAANAAKATAVFITR